MRNALNGPATLEVTKSDRGQFSEPVCVGILAPWRLSNLAASDIGTERGEMGARARLPLLEYSGSSASR